MNKLGIYPGEWSDIKGENKWGNYLVDNFLDLKEFVVQGASNNFSLIIGYR